LLIWKRWFFSNTWFNWAKHHQKTIYCIGSGNSSTKRHWYIAK